jgi:hypothetical protein
MIGRILGAVIGSRIDRRDGSGGMKGALTGALLAGGMRRMGPLGLALGAAYMGKKALDQRRFNKRGY